MTNEVREKSAGCLFVNMSYHVGVGKTFSLAVHILQTTNTNMFVKM